MAFLHKSKLQVYRELKQEVGFEEYSQYVKGAPIRLFFTLCLGTMDCLRSWVGMLRESVCHRNVLIVGLVKSR